MNNPVLYYIILYYIILYYIILYYIILYYIILYYIILYYIILYYNLMGPPSYMRSVVDRNVVMRRIPVFSVAAERALISRDMCLFPADVVRLLC